MKKERPAFARDMQRRMGSLEPQFIVDVIKDNSGTFEKRLQKRSEKVEN